jgi:hypothetical protein
MRYPGLTGPKRTSTPTELRLGSAQSRNPFRVEQIFFQLTQGSALRATLGWRTKSLWDFETEMGPSCASHNMHMLCRHPEALRLS